MTADPDVTVVVASTDRYSDCWQAFFRLFGRFWSDCPYSVVLLTETKTFESDHVAIRCHHAGAQFAGPQHWSDCLLSLVREISTPYILYLQEDYFLKGRVNQQVIAEFVRIMSKNRLAHVRLAECDQGRAAYQNSGYAPQIWSIEPHASYLVSLQAGLWSTAALGGLLINGESAADFEKFGTVRARQRGIAMHCENLDRFDRIGEQIVPYTPTGIVNGRWNLSAVVPLLADNGIFIDFSARGFIEGIPQSPYVVLRRKARAFFVARAPWVFTLLYRRASPRALLDNIASPARNTERNHL